MSNLSRRMLVASAAAIPAAAMALPSTAAPDAELRRLWAIYLGRVAEDEAARQKYSLARDAYDAEEPPCPDGVLEGHHWESLQWLRDKHGVDPLYDAWGEAGDRADTALSDFAAGLGHDTQSFLDLLQIQDAEPPPIKLVPANPAA
jgi:hypothetical protein